MMRAWLAFAVLALAWGGSTALARTAGPPGGAPTPAVWIAEPLTSRIGFSTTWAGQRVSGQFSSWTADIRFDPAGLSRSRAIVAIATASARTGQKDPDANLMDRDWFNPKAFPSARFETVAIRALGGGRYEADSRVTIRGVTVPALLAFSLSITGNRAQMTGTATLDRLAFGLGAESDPGADWVDRQVRVDVNLTATRRP